MKLSKNFELGEFLISQTAERMNIDNSPGDYVLENLKMTAYYMEKVRELLGNNPIFISSGFRNHEVNRAIGGSSTSSHMTGYAVDFTCRRFGTPYDVCLAIQKSDLKYDQLIHEFGRWVHISFDPKGRQQDLTIFKDKYNKTKVEQGINHA